MIKKRHVLHLAMGVVMTSLLGSCAADEIVGGAGSGNGVLSFGVEVNAGASEVKPMGGATRAADKADGSTAGDAVMSTDVEGFFPTSSVALSSVDGNAIYANCDERSGIRMHNNVDYKATRGSIQTQENFYSTFNLYGYVYDSSSEWASVSGYTSVDTNINGIAMMKGNGNDYNADEVYWPGASKNATFFAVAPYSANTNVTASTGGPTITYTVPQTVSSQQDLLVAMETDVKCDGNSAPSLTFKHALAAIKFKQSDNLGDYTSISIVEISGVCNKGKLSSFDNPAWTELSVDGNTNTYTMTDLSNVMFLMPQTVTTNAAKLKVTFKNDTEKKTFEADLNGTTWQAGHQYTYSLSVNKVTGKFIFEVNGPSESVSADGGTANFTVKSYYQYDDGIKTVPIPWSCSYTVDGNTNTLNGDGSVEGEENSIYIGENTNTIEHTQVLRSKSVQGSEERPYDLSTNNGESNMNTANCYVITSPGYYKLPLVYGNAVKDGSANTIAYASETFVDHNGTQISQPYIYETDYGPANAKLLWQDAPQLVTNCNLIEEDGKKKYLKFEVSSENIDQGNAVIAVQNGSGTTLWSWHIWVTDHDYHSTIAVQNSTGQTANFMPVPLGWCDTSIVPRNFTLSLTQGQSGKELLATIAQAGSTAGNAPFYQWGRKDPFVGSTGSGNTTKTWYDGSDVTKTNNNPVISRTRTKEESIKHPEKFISGTNWDSSTTYDNWNANVTGQPASKTDAYNDNAVEKTVYDPSPVGFKMPTTNAFTGFRSGTTGTTPLYVGSWNAGYDFKTGLSSPYPTSIYFRANGYRSNSDGSLGNVATNGFFWASGPYSNTTNGCYLYFNAGHVNPLYSSNRALGFSVRPVSE